MKFRSCENNGEERREHAICVNCCPLCRFVSKTITLNSMTHLRVHLPHLLYILYKVNNVEGGEGQHPPLQSHRDILNHSRCNVVLLACKV